MRAIDDVLLPSPNLPTSVKNYLLKMEPEFKLLREGVSRNQLEFNIKTTENSDDTWLGKARLLPDIFGSICYLVI